MPMTSLLVLAILGQGTAAPPQTTDGQAPPAPKQQAAPLISKMFAKYFGAKTLTGKITLTQGVDNEAGKIETIVQLEKPYLLYIKQTFTKTPPQVWITSSDGKFFCYDLPSRVGWGKASRLVEKQALDYDTLKIADVYHASSESLGDRSMPLDLAIASSEDLTKTKNQWATLKYEGMVDYNGQKVHVISGSWRASMVNRISGEYRLLITDEGDLKQYTMRETVLIDPKLGPKTVVSVWDVDLKVDGTPDKSLFKIYRKL